MTMTTVTFRCFLWARRRPISERGVECPGDLPAASDPTWSSGPGPPRPRSATGSSCSATTTSATRSSQFADVTGDSFKLARDAAARPEAEYIVFCGVHFMAETADILTAPAQQVILPDLAAGCSMADMAGSTRSRTPGTRWPTPESPTTSCRSPT